MSDFHYIAKVTNTEEEFSLEFEEWKPLRNWGSPITVVKVGGKEETSTLYSKPYTKEMAVIALREENKLRVIDLEERLEYARNVVKLANDYLEKEAQC